MEVPKWTDAIKVSDRVVFLGSCFAQYIGERFQSYGLRAVCNPLGVLYNPESIRLQVHAALHRGEEPVPVFPIEGEWRSWWAGTQISGQTEDDCRTRVDNALAQLGQSLVSADFLFLTLGTNVCYRLTADGSVVTNCHRAPHSLFREDSLPLPACEASLMRLTEDLLGANPRLKVVFTVSPYRYAKYGYHGSQLAKATLLLAAEHVRQQRPGQVRYFPAYEMVMDELRDYRFYAEDMLHPSPVAIDYIWQRLVCAAMDASTQEYLQLYAPIRSGLQHIPSHPDSAEYKRFLASLEEKARVLRERFCPAPPGESRG